jgi:hypothetical protein
MSRAKDKLVNLGLKLVNGGVKLANDGVKLQQLAGVKGLVSYNSV